MMMGTSTPPQGALACSGSSELQPETGRLSPDEVFADLVSGLFGSGIGRGATMPLGGAALFAPWDSSCPWLSLSSTRGGTLAVAGIHLSAVTTWTTSGTCSEERTLTSVTANTPMPTGRVRSCWPRRSA